LVKQDKIWKSYFDEISIGVWEDDTYFVAGFQDGNTIRLDIHRKDWKDGITWDELQRIKDECGYSDKDAVEFYPAKDAIINNGNFRHLYIFNDHLPLIRR
jgi:hypothetical protein